MKFSQIAFSVLLVAISIQLNGQDSVTDYTFIQLNQEHNLNLEEDKNLATIEMKVPEIRQFLANKINYPTSMLTYNIKGSSRVSININELGTIEDVTIVESLGSEFDREIKSALHNMNIGPVSIKGSTGKQKIIFPIHFEI